MPSHANLRRTAVGLVGGLLVLMLIVGSGGS